MYVIKNTLIYKAIHKEAISFFLRLQIQAIPIVRFESKRGGIRYPIMMFDVPHHNQCGCGRRRDGLLGSKYKI